MANVAEAMAEFLKRHGVDLVVGQSLPSAFHLAVPATGMRQIQVRTENAGTALCDAYARVSCRVPVMTAQNGPAATLLIPGLAEALKASVPILAIVQDVPVAHRDRNAFQEFDHIALFSSCAKWIRRLEAPDRVYDYVNLALTHATSGRPGPAVLLVPPEVLLEEAPVPPTKMFARGTYPLDRNIAEPARVQEAARILSAAKRPLIVAGGGVHASSACAELVTLQQEFGFPIGTTSMGKGVIDETHPLSLGVIGYLLGRRAPNRRVREYVEQSDVVFFVGTRTNQNGTDSWTLFDPKAEFIHLDVDGREIGRNYESLRLVGDAKLTLDTIIAALRRVDREKGRARRERLAKVLPPRQDAAGMTCQDNAKIRPEFIVAEINKQLGEKDIFVADASYSSGWLAAYGIARHPGSRFLSPRGIAGLGWGLPYMLGAKLARPEAKVVGLTGDGGMAHVWAELETALRHQINVVCIVLKNNVLGYQRDAELVKFGRHTNAIPIGEIDHAAIARACGCMGLSVERAEDFGKALRTGWAANTPVVIDVRVDASAYPPITLLDKLQDDQEKQLAAASEIA